MPLTPYLRGSRYWVRGRCDGIDGYVERSLRTSDEQVAIAKVREIERKARQRAVLGSDAPRPEDELTFAAAVTLYPASPADAGYLLKVMPALGAEKVRDIKPKRVRQLAANLYPTASTDTWRRQVIVPVRAVINNAHDLGRCAPIRIKGFTSQERVEQDRRRGRTSRREKTAGSWEWLHAFRANANPYLGAMALFLFTTAARIGQAVALEPRDLDLRNGRVMMPGAKGHAEQWVDIIPEIVVDLANLKPRRGKVFGYASRHSVYGAWQTAIDRAGIERIMPHAAGRHGFATELLIRRGLDVATAAKHGRWSSPRVLLDTYTHSDGGPAVRDAFRAGFHANSAKPGQRRTATPNKRMK